jgi:hypothetical protein
MGKTVPSFRLALEEEIERWKSFRQALGSQEDREAFDEMMDMCRNNASESGNACNPVIFQPMVMSIALAQEKRIMELEYGLNEVFWQRSSLQTGPSEGENLVRFCVTCNAEVLAVWSSTVQNAASMCASTAEWNRSGTITMCRS